MVGRPLPLESHRDGLDIRGSSDAAILQSATIVVYEVDATLGCGLHHGSVLVGVSIDNCTTCTGSDEPVVDRDQDGIGADIGGGGIYVCSCGYGN